MSTSNFVEVFIVTGETRDTLSRSVGQLDRKQKYDRLSASVKISKIQGAKLIKLETSQFKTVCKDDSGYITQLKQQKSKRVDITCQHVVYVAMSYSVISPVLIFGVLYDAPTHCHFYKPFQTVKFFNDNLVSGCTTEKACKRRITWRVTQGCWKCHHSISHVHFSLMVCSNNCLALFLRYCHFYSIHDCCDPRSPSVSV